MRTNWISRGRRGVKGQSLHTESGDIRTESPRESVPHARPAPLLCTLASLCFGPVSRLVVSLGFAIWFCRYPAQFATYLNYCRGLRFEEKPDYAYLRRLFRELYIQEGFKDDNIYDWTPMNRDGNDTNETNKKE